MLSNEEKKAIEWLKKADWFSARLYAPTILYLIEKQSKEIEELKEKNESLIKERATEIVYVDKNFVRKDKIKAKIEYLLKRYDSEEDFCSYDVLISILQSLLEKE